MKVYLAGPEVFLPNAQEILDKKVTMARFAGFTPVAPGDLKIPHTQTPRERGENIHRMDEQLMHSADAIIANLTPFRGIHADVGTAFEVGFMRALGKPIFAYSNVTDNHYKRVADYYDGHLISMPNGELRGPDGMLLEDFEMNENLMLDGAVAASGGAWVSCNVSKEYLYSETEAFKKILTIAAQKLLGKAALR